MCPDNENDVFFKFFVMKLPPRYGGGSVDDPSDLASPVRQEDEDDSDGEEPLLSGEGNEKKKPK